MNEWGSGEKKRKVAFYKLMLPSLHESDLNGDDERVAGVASLRHFHSHSAMNDRHDGGDDLMNCSFRQKRKDKHESTIRKSNDEAEIF